VDLLKVNVTQLEAIVSIGRLGIITLVRSDWKSPGVCAWRWWGGAGIDVCSGARSQGITAGVTLIIGLAWGCRGGVQTPLGLERFVNWSGRRELQVASLFGDHSALVSWLQARNQLGLKAAGFLRVQVTDFLWHINEGGQGFVVTLLWQCIRNTASTANLNWQLLTGGVSDKLARLLLNIFGGAAGLVHCPALLWALAVAHLFHRSVALLDRFINSLLFESDLACLLKIFIAHFFLSRLKLGDIGVMALFHIGVGTLKDGVLFNGLYSFQFFNTTQPSFWVLNTSTKVHSTLYGVTPVSSKPCHQSKGS